MTITFGLMIVIALVTFAGGQLPDLQRRLMLNPYKAFHHKQLYRLLTSGFVHNNRWHLFLNLFTLYFYGQAIEKRFNYEFEGSGLVFYLLLFLSAIVVANLTTLIKHRNNPNYNSLGASGGVSALILSFILFGPFQDLCITREICLPGYALGLLFILYSIIMSRRGKDNVNHDAHLMGAVYGVVFTLIARPGTLETFIEVLFH